MSILASLKQLSYPDEFRIADAKWPNLSETLKDLLNLLQFESQLKETSTSEGSDLLNVMSYIGTIIWRLQVRSIKEVEASERIRRISRDLEAAHDVLTQGGIEIEDHTGKPYDGGMKLHVIAFQPTAGILREKIIQTIKPTIYHKDKIIQTGEVIVGTPLKDSTLKKNDDPG